MEMGVFRFKGKGKRKYKDLNEERGNESKSSDPNDVECYYYGKKNRKKSDGLQCEVDLNKAKCRNCFTNMLLGILNGKFKGDTQKDIQSWKSGIWNSWDFSVAPMCDKCCMKGVTLDSGATVNVCPGEYGMQSGRHIELQAVDASLVENHGSRDMRHKVGDEAMNVRFDVTSVKKPIVSTVALEDTGWWLGDQGDFMGVRRGDLLLRVDRVNDVYWILDLEGLDKDRYDLVTDRVCSLEEIELEQQQVVAARWTLYSAEVETVAEGAVC